MVSAAGGRGQRNSSIEVAFAAYNRNCYGSYYSGVCALYIERKFRSLCAPELSYAGVKCTRLRSCIIRHTDFRRIGTGFSGFEPDPEA